MRCYFPLLHGFNPRTPCGVRLVYKPVSPSIPEFQSTHSLRSATLNRITVRIAQLVSIHALLAECDIKKLMDDPDTKVSIHALLAECDFHAVPRRFRRRVSIHALLAECDFALRYLDNIRKSFNPRTPCGVRRKPCGATSGGWIVSIHALLAECDTSVLMGVFKVGSFNPRTPCGVRRA